jgi:hypothetical protein
LLVGTTDAPPHSQPSTDSTAAANAQKMMDSDDDDIYPEQDDVYGQQQSANVKTEDADEGEEEGEEVEEDDDVLTVYLSCQSIH